MNTRRYTRLCKGDVASLELQEDLISLGANESVRREWSVSVEDRTGKI